MQYVSFNKSDSISWMVVFNFIKHCNAIYYVKTMSLIKIQKDGKCNDGKWQILLYIFKSEEIDNSLQYRVN